MVECMAGGSTDKLCEACNRYQSCPYDHSWEDCVNAAKQEAKADASKPRLTLVPRRIIWDIAEIREYGTRKYGDPENWRRVEVQRYRDAAYRHFMAYLDDPQGVDAESGMPHLWHLACNVAFLCELDQKGESV